jgi:hypothetical protein
LELAGRSITVGPVSATDINGLKNPSRHDGARVVKLRQRLATLGFLSPLPAAPVVPGYLAADQLALAERLGAAGAAVLARRRKLAVTIHGRCRIAAPLAATLAGAGIGTVQLAHTGEVAAADSCPGGVAPNDEGKRFGTAGADAVFRCAPDARLTPGTQPGLADLAILTDPKPVAEVVHDSLHLSKTVHLVATVVRIASDTRPTGHSRRDELPPLCRSASART